MYNSLSESPGFRIKFCLSLLLITASVVIRFSVSGPLSDLREKAVSVLTENIKIEETVSALGKTMIGDREAVSVFSQGLLGTGK